MFKEFKEFAFKGNVLELAIAVVMGEQRLINCHSISDLYYAAYKINFWDNLFCEKLDIYGNKIWYVC